LIRSNKRGKLTSNNPQVNCEGQTFGRVHQKSIQLVPKQAGSTLYFAINFQTSKQGFLKIKSAVQFAQRFLETQLFIYTII